MSRQSEAISELIGVGSREKSDETLKLLIAEPEIDRDWQLYIDYCRNRLAGLREKAMLCIKKFVQVAQAWDFSKRRKFVSWLLTNIENRNAYTDKVVPDPLWSQIIDPTLLEWSQGLPSEATPFRWMGLWGDTDNLYLALEIDSYDHRARKALLRGRLLSLLQSLDHLNEPIPIYSGDPVKDILLVKEALAVLEQPQSSGEMDKYKDIFLDIKILIEDFISFKQSRHRNFREWCSMKNLEHDGWLG